MDFPSLKTVVEVFVECNGVRIIDSQSASLLKAIKDKRSISLASQSIGISYSTAWEIIARIEKICGRKVVETKRGGRGGGGARLTDFGEKLLDTYFRALKSSEQNVKNNEGVLRVAYSSDPAFEHLLSRLEKSIEIHSHAVGSGMALAMLTVGDVDVACSHLYDPDEKTYNLPFLRRLWLLDRVERIGAYERELVFAYRRDLGIDSLEDGIRKVLEGKIRFSARNKGSGTRELCESVFSEYAEKLGVKDLKIKGIEMECRSHEEVARRIAEGKADAGILHRYPAEKYGLEFFHLTWEKYECFALKNSSSDSVSELKKALNSEWFRSLLEVIPGYRV